MIPGTINSGYRANAVLPGSTAASVTRISHNGTDPFVPSAGSVLGVASTQLAYGNGEYMIASEGKQPLVRKGLTSSYFHIPKPSSHLGNAVMYCEVNGTKYWFLAGPTMSNGSTWGVSYATITNSASEITSWTNSATFSIGQIGINVVGFGYNALSTATPFYLIMSKQTFAYTTAPGTAWTVSTSPAWGSASFVNYMLVPTSNAPIERFVIGSQDSSKVLWYSDSNLNLNAAGTSLGSGSPIGANTPIDMIHSDGTWVVACSNSNAGMYSVGGTFTSLSNWTATTIAPASYYSRALVERNGNVIVNTSIATSDKYLCRATILPRSGGSGGGISAWTQNSVSTTTEGSRKGLNVNPEIPHVWLTATGAIEYSW